MALRLTAYQRKLLLVILTEELTEPKHHRSGGRERRSVQIIKAKLQSEIELAEMRRNHTDILDRIQPDTSNTDSYSFDASGIPLAPE